jgi:hypothetical protein
MVSHAELFEELGRVGLVSPSLDLRSHMFRLSVFDILHHRPHAVVIKFARSEIVRIFVFFYVSGG